MSSLCSPANPTHSLQELMIDCLVDYPNNHHQENGRNIEQSAQSIYWTDELALTSSSSALSRYHAALAVGATVVCSAGAIMQHTETGFWYRPVLEIDLKNTTPLKLAQTEPSVVTPPVAGSQSTASFSPRGNGAKAQDEKITCTPQACRGLALIEQRLPELRAQVQTIQAEIERFQTTHAGQSLQTHRSVLAHRSAEVTRRHSELEQRSQQLNQQLASLTSALGIHPDEAKQIASLLDSDSDYQTLLQQLKHLQNALSIEYSSSDLDNPQQEALHAQYTQLAEQLRQIAQFVIGDYIATARVQSPDPLWQEDSYYGLLQELIDLAHLRQMLVIEKGTLAKIDEQLTQRQTELAVLLRQYAVLQQRLDGQNKILQQYLAKRQELKTISSRSVT